MQVLPDHLLNVETTIPETEQINANFSLYRLGLIVIPITDETVVAGLVDGSRSIDLF